MRTSHYTITGYLNYNECSTFDIFTVISYLQAFFKDSEEKQERIKKAELDWKNMKMQQRRQAQKKLQRKAKKEMEEEKKKLEKRKDSAKTFSSWQVKYS